MKVDDIRIGKSALTDTVFAGKLDKSGRGWSSKKDVTSDFYNCVIGMFNGCETIIHDDKGKKWSVVVKEIPR